MKLERIKTSTGNSILINDKYQLYDDGIIYDITTPDKDIPQWIFEFRDWILQNYQTMKHQLEIK